MGGGVEWEGEGVGGGNVLRSAGGGGRMMGG